MSLSQDYYDDPVVINIPYDQIDILVRWLQDAKAEIEENRSTILK